VETPPQAIENIGSPTEQAILHSLGEMTKIFKDWVTNQGQSQRNDQIQGRELERKQRQELNFQFNA